MTRIVLSLREDDSGYSYSCYSLTCGWLDSYATRAGCKGNGFSEFSKHCFLLMARDYDIEEFGTKVGYVLEENCL